MGNLTRAIEYEGPQVFSAGEICAEADLFAERCALFYTPTENLPSEWVGEGSLDVLLPIATPSFSELLELYWRETPRFWVDLLQRATGKLRWRPVSSSVRLTILRYDSIMLPRHGISGAKALVDSLKVRTTGRIDGRLLYYFGAIVDDGPRYIADWNFEQERVAHPSDAKTRVIVQPAQCASRRAIDSFPQQ